MASVDLIYNTLVFHKKFSSVSINIILSRLNVFYIKWKMTNILFLSRYHMRKSSLFPRMWCYYSIMSKKCITRHIWKFPQKVNNLMRIFSLSNNTSHLFFFVVRIKLNFLRVYFDHSKKIVCFMFFLIKVFLVI